MEKGEAWSRIAAAIVGGYFLAVSASVLFSHLLRFFFGAGKGDAVVTSVYASFLFYTVAIAWVFATEAHRRMWVTLIVMLTGTGLLNYLLFVIEHAA